MNIVMVMNECVGPRCIKNCSIRSMSGMTETINRRGKLSLTPASFDELFPNMYPKAK